MTSDNDYDIFDYSSSQDNWEIDYQIDLFEFRQLFKGQKQSKQKIKKPSCPISVKALKSQAALVKISCAGYKKTPKAERKPFRHDRYPIEREFFECDEAFEIKPTENQTDRPAPFSKQLEDEHLQNFSNFRHHFYQVNHQRIKSALKEYPDIEISNIRFASVDESVQDQFMTNLNEDSCYFPQLVYHGTRLTNIASILRFGFLVPDQAHPTNKEAPIIRSANGQSYGKGIYCSQTATYSLSYLNTTNTLLVCAALPKHDRTGRVKFSYRNILVLFNVSQIIPLFLIDFQYLNRSGINRPWYEEIDKSETNEIEVKRKPVPVVISRKYLRKVLATMNDHERKKDLYQVRMFEPFN